MQDEDPYAKLVDITKRYTLLAEALERNASQAAQQHDHSVSALQHSVERAQHQLLSSAQQIERLLREQMDRAVTQTLGGSVRQFDDAVQSVAKQARQTGEGLREDHAALSSGLKRMLWKVHAVAIASTSVLLLGGGLLLFLQHQAYRAAQARTAAAEVEAEMAEALREAQVTSCGGRPCIKLDLNTPRWGKHREYVLLAGTSGDSGNTR